MTLFQTKSLARRIAHAISFDNPARPPVLIKTTDAKTRAAVFLTNYSLAPVRVAVYNNNKKTRLAITYNGVLVCDWTPENMFITAEMIIAGACKAVARHHNESRGI